MKQFLRCQKLIFLVFFFSWMSFGLVQFIFSQNEILLGINTRWNPTLDLLMPVITLLGDGFFCFLLGVIGLFLSYRLGVTIILSFALSGLFVQIIKRFIFPNAYRPAKVLSDILDTLHQVPGIPLRFPSGHTASAFALFTTLAMYSKNKRVKIALILTPTLVAFSRMYLFVHFPKDVWVGAITGVTFAVMCHYLLETFWQKEGRLSFKNILLK